MQDGVAVKPDQRHLFQPVAGDQRFYRLSMGMGQIALGGGMIAGAAQRVAQPLAQPRLIGNGQRRPSDDALATVALDQRRIDAVERGAAHKADRPHESRPDG